MEGPDVLSVLGCSPISHVHVAHDAQTSAVCLSSKLEACPEIGVVWFGYHTDTKTHENCRFSSHYISTDILSTVLE